MQLLDVSIHAVHTCAPEHFPITIEAVAARAGWMPGYYRVQLDGVRMVITDQHRRDIIDCLANAPRLPKSDEQIDADRENDSYAIGQGDVEVFRG